MTPATPKDELQLIKEYALLPMLLGMIARDAGELKLHKDKLIYRHLLYHLDEVERAIYGLQAQNKTSMRQLDIFVLNVKTDAGGVNVQYKHRGYEKSFSMLRPLIKAELMNILWQLGGIHHDQQQAGESRLSL
ncbi:hypothetical protein B5M42_023010 [Paenibacillus athensensis]|uniref:Uncharacterized protein n=1 Tax=Paenibacillus athensensis TaxID=1967502 RepID=A0A4Y8PQ95_9BACL|nr:hypothetical protein [Paenibacillus athensensis]MCD1261677.1 hypothetical protein [Paenibacillus athensensis]